MHKFYKSFNFSYLYLFQNTFKIIFTHVIYYVFLKLKEVNPIFKYFWFLDSYFEKQRGRNYFCLYHFQIYIFHLHTLTKGNLLFLKVVVWQNEIYFSPWTYIYLIRLFDNVKKGEKISLHFAKQKKNFQKQLVPLSKGM